MDNFKGFPLTVFCALLIFFSAPGGAGGEEQIPDGLGEEYYYFMAEEVVTPTKAPRPIYKAPAIVVVVTKEQIKNMGAQTLRDVLENIPGLGVTNMRYGKYALEVRGIKTVNSEKVLLMINGHRVNTPLFGAAQYIFNDMIVDNVERVEVVRGPGSALYGTGAFLTTVNVITRRARDADGGRVELRGGTFSTGGVNFLWGKESNEAGVFCSIDYLETDGPALRVKEDGATVLGQPSYAPGNTNCWMEKLDLELDLNFKGFYWQNRFVRKRSGDYIGIGYALGDDTLMDLRQWFSLLGWEHAFSPQCNLKAEAYVDHFIFDIMWQVYPPGFGGGFLQRGMVGHPSTKNLTRGAELQLDLALFEGNSLTLGWNLERIKQYDTKHVANFNPNTGADLGSMQRVANWSQDVRRRVWAFYLQDTWGISDEVDFTMGGRYDHYNDFGDTFNPRGGVTWQADRRLGLKLLYGRAFRAPNFEQLYNVNNPSQLGNPDLKAEKVNTFEAEANYRFSIPLELRVNYFYNRIKDLIGVQANGGGQLQFANSSGTTRVQGVEVELRGKSAEEGYEGYVNYTFIRPRDENGDRIQDVALHRGNAGVNLPLCRYVNSNTRVQVVGKRYRAAGDARDAADPFVLVHQSIILKDPAENFEFQLTVFNLLNKKYSDPAVVDTVAGDYPRPGINFVCEGRYLF